MNVYEKMWKQLKRELCHENSVLAEALLERMSTIMGEHYEEIVQHHRQEDDGK